MSLMMMCINTVMVRYITYYLQKYEHNYSYETAEENV